MTRLHADMIDFVQEDPSKWDNPGSVGRALNSLDDAIKASDMVAFQVITKDRDGNLAMVTMGAASVLAQAAVTGSPAAITVAAQQVLVNQGVGITALTIPQGALLGRLAAGQVAANTYANIEAEWPYVPVNVADGVQVTAPITASITVTNSAVNTSIAKPAIPANTLGTNRVVRIELWWHYTNNTGGNKRLAFKLIYGSTTLIDTNSSVIISTSAFTRAGKMEIDLIAFGGTGLQYGNIRISMDGNPAARAAGWGGHVSATAYSGDYQGIAAEDSTGALDLDVQMRMTTADANHTFTIIASRVRLL